MTKPLKHLIPHYLLLAMMFLTGGLAFVTLDDSLFRWTVLLGLVGLYVVWGAWHHYEEGSLSHQVVLEYIGVALLIGAVLVIAGA